MLGSMVRAGTEIIRISHCLPLKHHVNKNYHGNSSGLNCSFGFGGSILAGVVSNEIVPVSNNIEIISTQKIKIPLRI